MKNIVAVILIALISIPGISQTKSATISFDQDIHDFGKIPEEAGKVNYKFSFVNTGGSPMLVQNVRATCGCTAPSWTKEPVPPGGKGFVTATFNPAGRPGAFTKYLYVDSNTDQGMVKLTIKGEVVPKPKTLEDDYRYSMGGLRLKANHLAFGNITNAETKDYRLDVINSSDKNLDLEFDRIPSHMTVEFVPKVLKPGQKGQIVATYDASKKNDWGMLIDRVNVNVNGVSERNYRIVVSANVVEDFSALTPEEMAKAPIVSVDNPEVNFGTIDQSQKFEHEFVVSNDGKSTLVIRKVKSSCGCTAVKPEKNQIEPGESVKIKAIFNPAGRRGNQSKTITVITNDPDRPSTILRIKGEVSEGEA